VPQVTRVLRELLPRRHWTPEDLWHWLLDTQRRNAHAKRAHRRRRLARIHEPSL
jgi:predicted transposase YbfD/YdcC